MPTLRELVKSTVEADATLTALLPGGFMDANDLPQDGGGAGSAPRQADEVRINPFGIIRYRAGNRTQADVPSLRSGQQSIEIYVYEDVGYGVIDAAIDRLITLLDNKYLYPSDRAIVHLLHTFDSEEIRAEEFGNAPSRFVRFQTVSIR